MKESYGKGLASHPGPKLCGGGRKVAAEALAGETAGRVLSSEITTPACRLCNVMGKAS